MENNRYYDKEDLCHRRFENNVAYYHLNTPENHPLIFFEDVDFKAGMSLIGICSRMFPNVKIYTFELMDNHLHIIAGGPLEDILAMFEQFKTFLLRYLKGRGLNCDLSCFNANISKIEDLDYLRNAIAYVNRNGAVVNPDESPYSYRWGANNLFFNGEAKSRHREMNRPLKQITIQAITHSRKCDQIDNLTTIDDYVTPMSFCHIEEAEGFFRDARHYFYSIAKNVEGYKEIASLTGETIFYTDQDIHQLLYTICKNEYNCESVDILPPDAKRALAKRLHYDYHCNNKQIQRILKLSQFAVDQLFPLSAK